VESITATAVKVTDRIVFIGGPLVLARSWNEFTAYI
jgi:hypothetical protein